jgi:F0F1-type ATP synthase membrane subunit c/vacuolar-type H+-ATPase subunit K
MSGIIAVYALVIAVLIAGDMGPPPQQNYSLYTGFMHLASGLSVGLTGLAAGYAIGVVGDMGVRCYMQQSRIFVGMVLILIFGEVLGLYGYVFRKPFVSSTTMCWSPTDMWQADRGAHSEFEKLGFCQDFFVPSGG